MDKVVCESCGWGGDAEEMLTGKHPFRHGELCYGCPNCNEIETVVAMCDEPGCKFAATCGTPTKDGYRQTCTKHMPDITERTG